MADVGTRRQREDQSTSSSQSTGQSTSLTPSERTEARSRQSQGSQGMERYQQGRYTPSVFSVSPGEFFTLSPITSMRRFTEDSDRAFGLSTGRSRSSDLDVSTEDFTWMPTIEVRQQGDNLVIHADLPGLSEKDVRVEVTDDGVGFPENFDPSTDGGLGFQLMRALANGLNAELRFEHDSLGVCARLVRRKYLAS